MFLIRPLSINCMIVCVLMSSVMSFRSVLLPDCVLLLPLINGSLSSLLQYVIFSCLFPYAGLKCPFIFFLAWDRVLLSLNSTYPWRCGVPLSPTCYEEFNTL